MLLFHFLRYLYALFEYSKAQGLARGNVDLACAAVDCFHAASGYPSPTSDISVQDMRKGIGRELGVKGQQAIPLGDDVVKRMWQSLQTSPTKGSLQAFIIILVVAVMREGMMRWDDVSRVTFRDVFITEQYARVFVNERKTDYKREGFWAMIPQRSEAWSVYQLLRQVAARFAGEFAKLSLAQ